MEEKIYSIISDIIKVDIDEIKAKTSEPGLWDSLNRVEIIFEIEDEFDIVFEQEEIAEMNTVDKILEVIRSKQ